MGEVGNRSKKVFLLDADERRAAALTHRLQLLEYETIDIREARRVNASEGIAVVFATGDTRSATDQLAADLRRESPELPFLCLGNADPGDGANWPLSLPLKCSQLKRLLERAQRYRGRERRERLTGTSYPIRHVRELIEQVADFDTNVLVTGQSGTGKELVAKTIHELSRRSGGPFVPLNCSAVPTELLESELFGHEKAAFTGATSARAGRFELADGGTLFLDEIGDMCPDMQVKLLRVLQERRYERVGSNRSRRTDVRIIAATHVDLPAAIEAGRFREDLYYRLNVFPIEMPCLRQRITDLPLLLEQLAATHCGAPTGEARMSPAAMKALANYDWPGNIRELGNLVERLAIVKPEGTIELDDLPAPYLEAGRVARCGKVVNEESANLTAKDLKTHLQAIERRLIEQAIDASGGVVADAARLLSLRRTTLVEKISRFSDA